MALTLVRGDTRRGIDVARSPLPEALLAKPLVGVVRPEISESWRDCLAAGLAPSVFDVPFDSLPTEHGPLLAAASPVLDELVSDLRDARMAFVLTNQRGCVLDRRPSVTSLAARLDEVCLAEGFVHREDAVGTGRLSSRRWSS
jgi:transcriptional regulator of acetoin/glycerol metabolism